MLADESFQPGSILGRYRIVERIGEGGMASVWKAEHLALRKFVAIKTLRTGLTDDEGARARFLREGEAIARVRHPHVVEVHDVGIAGDTLYLVMEHLDGEDLRACLARRGTLPLAELADIVVPLCAALAAAHDEGVVHRDIKPGNLFLARGRDRVVVPKVLDFGVSRLVDDRSGRVHTGTAMVIGTPRYMAPEQARGGRAIDGRADQYALGVILYQCATGQVPIDDTAVFELLRRVVRGEFAPPRVLRPDLPEAFEAIVLRAMATKPEQRFPTLREMGAALLPFASERTRVIHGEALTRQPTPAPLPAPAAELFADPTPAPAPPPVVAPLPPSSRRGARILSGLLASVAVLAFGLALWLVTRGPRRDPPPAAPVALRAPVAAPPPLLPLPIATPPPVVTPVAAPEVTPVAAPVVTPVAVAAPPVVARARPLPVRRPRAVVGARREPRLLELPPTPAPAGVDTRDVD
jgi:serine/threonine-protein kinase